MVLVDASVWIEGLRRKGSLEVKLALESLLEAYEARLCPPARLEVLGGARKQERAVLGRYFSVLPYRGLTSQDWENAIALAWRLRDRGLTVPWMDVLIAALALTDGERLYALDRHFESISEITGLLLYQPGYGGAYQPD